MPGPAGGVTTTVPARTGLAGHPSDAFGGAVLAAPVPELAASVTVRPADEIVVGGCRYEGLDALLRTPHQGDAALLTAAVAELVTWVRASGIEVPATGFHLDATTTIPRSVGLAGSSAIVTGALRSLAAAWDVAIPDDTGPQLALATEVERLGIAAGPQDRIVQWHAATVLMDFGGESWSVERVAPPAPVELLVCWTRRSASPSHVTHAPLQHRRHDPVVREHMASLARLAHEAAGALRRGDLEVLGRCLDEGFEHRRALVPLDPRHVEIVEGLRARGAHATYTGSGGAVAALSPDVPALRAWALGHGLGAVVTTLR